MLGKRITLIVDVDLDLVPGWGHEPEDMRLHTQALLDQTIPHYNPVVTVGRSAEPDSEPANSAFEVRFGGVIWRAWNGEGDYQWFYHARLGLVCPRDSYSTLCPKRDAILPVVPVGLSEG